MSAAPSPVVTDHDRELARLLVQMNALREQKAALKRRALTLDDEEARQRRVAVMKGEQHRLNVLLSELVIRHGATIPGFTFEHDGERVLSIAPIQRSLL